MVNHSSGIEIVYEVALPFPPSINAMYRTVKGRMILSRRYRDWITEADQLAVSQKLRIGNPLRKFSVEISLNSNQRRNRDVDNHAKAILDWAQSRGLILNDRLTDRLTVGWVEDGLAPEGCKLRITGEA